MRYQLPSGYRMQFGLPCPRLMGLGALGMSAAQQAATQQLINAAGSNCDTLAAHAAQYEKLSTQTKRSKEYRVSSAEIAAIFRQKYSECMAARAKASAPVAPPPAPPPSTPPTPPPPVVPPVVIPSTTPEQVIGTQTTAYISPPQSSVPLSVPSPTVYQTPELTRVAQVSAADIAPQVVQECELPSRGMLPMTYRDQYGPMKVLAVYCSQAQAPAQAQSVQYGGQAFEQVSAGGGQGFDTSSAELWGGGW